ncbi:uncharacterized protein LOC120007110 isoform X1 [Tripterygium wilfordii]|uniref:uncharacterized protein LOC120007110 isoform X1 n=1 Tax=Tripterygium wilfordii TaxID=458696 RepID=UPI0018F802C7|nr:uncharacterized protein LOC120007110 isoform X1 [Tripterygium wilfordii]XP_038713221.1 uncharacterized protein LOC120007110 isoform X1 [Tripterygium wilfordii]
MRMSLLSRPNASSRSSSRKRFFGGGSMEEEERTAKGDDVIVDLDAKLEDLYMGGTMKLVGAVVFRVAIPHPAPHGLFHPPICSLLLGLVCMMTSKGNWGKQLLCMTYSHMQRCLLL